MRGLWNNVAVRKHIILFIMAVVVMSGLVTNGKKVSACDFGSNIIEPHTDSNVFVGKALEIRGDKNGKDVFFEVYKVEQGTVKALAKVWTPPAGSSCGGFDFKVGEMYYVITIDTPIFPSKKVVMINTVRPLLAEEKSEKEQIEGQSLLENFLKRTDVSVSMNGEDLVMNRPYDYFYSNKDNRVMVPLNEAFVSRFGIEVTPINEDDDSVTLNYMGKAYTYQIGHNTVRIDENDFNIMDTVIQRFDGITFIPARQVADMIGAQLTWDNKLKKICFSF
ncbi:copper amine oxidase N-terminal domain-containing protein [Paenibacillus sp. BC26]|uniref:copper amine oxidase N-terminal domain-containing protein n=1 Tax=Paenibacillus sp. BC26 TaxID=1881032 RepID=UPI0008EF3C74|nr:copper amine oxidase N-terminal domain-containing protein [Paenibacillus sp. BC26]SFS77409.1 Copper amine oxidase N-terminal domain-containing protein [Paenibacillus sp. BC26]